MSKVLITFFALCSVFISSCSVFMPYEEHYACKRGLDTGLCGSITDVYNYYDRGYTIKDAQKFLNQEKANVRMCDGIYFSGGVCR